MQRGTVATWQSHAGQRERLRGVGGDTWLLFIFIIYRFIIHIGLPIIGRQVY